MQFIRQVLGISLSVFQKVGSSTVEYLHLLGF